MQRRLARDPAQTATPGTMPRIGMQGSITRDQRRRLKAFHFEPSRLWSKEEADLILDSVVYLRAAILQVTGDAEPPEQIQNRILAFILSDDKLREYIISWGQNRRNKGSTAPGSLARNEHFERIAAFITSNTQGSTA